MLVIKNLSKTYKNGKKAVDDLTLRIEAGEVYGFIGHNGAGKTTTLKCIAGIITFENGDITVDGHSIKDDAVTCKRMFAYIPDNPDLYDNLTGIQYLNFIADIYGISKTDRETSIRYYADKLELMKNLGDNINSYSHGMKQKLAIISAFIRKPKFIMFDEPFVGLDPLAAHTLKEEMRLFCNNGGAIFFSTHVLEVAEKICDKVAIIKGGKLIVSGATQTITKDTSLENLFLELTDNGK